MTGPSLAQRPPKVLVTKAGLDGHDRDSRRVATCLRDAGMEVVYTAPWQEIATVVELALEEDVDVIGISSLAADRLLAPQVLTALGAAGLGHVRLVVGGILPDDEAEDLLRAGVARVFHPGSAREDIVAAFRELAADARAEI